MHIWIIRPLEMDGIVIGATKRAMTLHARQYNYQKTHILIIPGMDGIVIDLIAKGRMVAL